MDSLTVMLDSLAAYPGWFVALCITVVLAVFIWALIRVVKWLLYFMLAVVVVGGLGLAVWLLVR